MTAEEKYVPDSSLAGHRNINNDIHPKFWLVTYGALPMAEALFNNYLNVSGDS
jgi:hypothetical protein